jgi:hypothetical protein
MKNSRLLILLASLLLSLLYCPPVDILVDDKVIFRYAGLLMAKGGVPYIDLFDHKPPLIYFLYYAGPWGLWVIDSILVAFATLLFYERCHEKQLRYPYILPLFFNLLIRNYPVCEGIGMTRAYTAIFLLIAFCILLKRPRHTFFWLGLLAAATFLMQQDQILPILPFAAYAFITPRPTILQFLKNLAQATVGLLVITAPILFYLGYHHALAAFWHDAFLFNFQWYAEKSPLGDQFRAIHAGLKETDLIMPLVIAVTLAATALLQHAKDKLLIVAALIATALAFLPELFSARMALRGYSFYYYFLPLCSVLPILIFTAWTASEDPFFRNRINQTVFGFLLCAPLCYNAVQHATHLEKNGHIVSNTAEFQFLRRQHLSDYELYSFGNSNWAYAYDDFRILSPSPWIYHQFWAWYPGWDADHRILASIGNDLLAHHTRYVLDFSEGMTFCDPSAYAWWRTFLQQHYQPVEIPHNPGVRLWQIKQAGVNTRLSAGPPAS